ncbi:hypothetical protein PR202_gb00633 [Eleusine coracana subsp. coracana]|uniref:Uncharacterized protein n=1 Tax=Eleusine coracana subsp. coracana TaxID=191504 RepID=A0AAV5DTV6_ELECO|nr:hypothetical protein QOZ80_5BG0427250 [Eleusine coracana subsp. coracana]GJN13880.1 hypothetical protein PR202_gb00633 [Eleusine coracana subsp. coracana]
MLPETPAAAAWPHLASFTSLHLYMAGIDTCKLESGEDGQPGCVRYVARHGGGSSGEVLCWAREELLEMDHAARRLKYSVLETNMGSGRYVATLSVDEGAGGACKLTWAFECDPLPGMSMEGAKDMARVSVQSIASGIQQAVRAAAA